MPPSKTQSTPNMAQNNTMSELTGLIDQFLDENLNGGDHTARRPTQIRERPDSRGTLLVDYLPDGTLKVHYRNRKSSHSRIDSVTKTEAGPSATPPFPTTQLASEQFRLEKRKDGELYIRGKDLEEGIAYNYNGSVFHLRYRDSDASSDYYSLDGDAYDRNKSLLFVDKELPKLPIEKRTRRQQVLGFVEKLMRKFSDSGVLKTILDHRKARARRKEQRDGESWKRHGYAT